MFYYLYKLTDNKNNMYYYGVHKTNNLDDGYMGSGVRLNNTIKCRCTKQILEFFNSLEEMYKKEIEIVNETVVKDPMSYNMRVGGFGGDTISHHPRNKQITEKSKLTNLLKTEEEKKIINLKKARHGSDNGMFGVHRFGKSSPAYGRHHTEEAKAVLSKKAKLRCSQPEYVNPNKGKPCSEEQKQKIRKANARIYYFKFDEKDGIVEICNLAEFCREQNLNVGCMRHVAAGRHKQHRGYYRATDV